MVDPHGISEVSGPWSGLAGAAFDGYEIHHGRTRLLGEGVDTTIALVNESGDAIGWQRGTVLGLYAHGLFEAPAAMRALFGVELRSLDSVFEGLADFVDRGFAPGVLSSLVGR
jgi:adenosylcobyric acid synthase